MSASRFAVVTGTSSGVGRALAQGLLESGWRVLGVARRPQNIDHERYSHAALDLSDVSATAAWFRGPFVEAHDLSGYERVALVNNAATLSPQGPLHHASLEDLSRALILNVATPTWLMGLLASLAPEADLRIANLSSGAATSAYPGWGAYCISKAALRMAGRVLNVEREEIAEMDGRRIEVLDYAPGVVDTPMQLQARSADPQRFPRVQRFIDLHAKDELLSPEVPAGELLAWLEAEASGEGFDLRRCEG